MILRRYSIFYYNCSTFVIYRTYYNLWANQRWLCLVSAKETALLTDFIFCSFLLHIDISYANGNNVPKKLKNYF